MCFSEALGAEEGVIYKTARWLGERSAQGNHHQKRNYIIEHEIAMFPHGTLLLQVCEMRRKKKRVLEGGLGRAMVGPGCTPSSSDGVTSIDSFPRTVERNHEGTKIIDKLEVL